MPAAQIIWIFTLALTISAALLDWRSRRIPNWLTVPGFLSGVTLHVVLNGWHGLLFALGREWPGTDSFASVGRAAGPWSGRLEIDGRGGSISRLEACFFLFWSAVFLRRELWPSSRCTGLAG